MINFAFISPIQTMRQAMKASNIHLALAHIENETYRQSLRVYKGDKPTILDNGAYENGKPLEASKLLDIAEEVDADCIVAPDYPGQDWKTNVKSQLKFYDIAKDLGYSVMLVPQSVTGDAEGFIRGYKIFSEYMDEEDLIGFSVLGVPNAFNKVPRSFARYSLFKYLVENEIYPQYKSIHMLGLLDTPYEVALCRQFEGYINSWDSSQPIWAAYNNIRLGLITDKRVLPKVDFEADREVSELFMQMNINEMKGILK